MDKCISCGLCCKLFLINLTESEYKSGFYKAQFEEFGIIADFEEAELTAANILSQKDDGSCVYLEDNKCSIHNNKPKSCKTFFCSSKDPSFKTMIDKINKKREEKLF